MARKGFYKVENTILTREILRNFYISKYFNLYMNAYKFNGLDYQQKDFLLRKFWSIGTLAFFTTKATSDLKPQGELVITPYATSKLNIYDFPVEVNLIALKPVNFIPRTPQMVDRDVVIGYAQRNKKPVFYMVETLIDKIVEVEMILRTSLKSQKTPWMIAYTPESETQKENIKNNLESDNPYIFIESQDVNSFKALVSGANYTADKLYALKQCYENELREYLGIDNLGVNEKKEHLITSEVESNNEAIESAGECFLDCLKELCERIREVLGYEVSVELNKPDSLVYNEDGEEDTENKEEDEDVIE